MDNGAIFGVFLLPILLGLLVGGLVVLVGVLFIAARALAEGISALIGEAVRRRRPVAELTSEISVAGSGLTEAPTTARESFADSS